jgi:hypothetical protein
MEDRKRQAEPKEPRDKITIDQFKRDPNLLQELTNEIIKSPDEYYSRIKKGYEKFIGDDIDTDPRDLLYHYLKSDKHDTDTTEVIEEWLNQRQPSSPPPSEPGKKSKEDSQIAKGHKEEGEDIEGGDSEPEDPPIKPI